MKEKPQKPTKPIKISGDGLLVVTLDDILILLFLSLTVWHTVHILSTFELKGSEWLAWPLALGIDIGIARAAWVTFNQSIPGGARWLAGFWLLGLLLASYGLNVAFYAGQGADLASWFLSSFFPISLAAAGGIKSFLARAKAEKAQAESKLVAINAQLQQQIAQGNQQFYTALDAHTSKLNAELAAANKRIASLTTELAAANAAEQAEQNRPEQQRASEPVKPVKPVLTLLTQPEQTTRTNDGPLTFDEAVLLYKDGKIKQAEAARRAGVDRMRIVRAAEKLSEVVDNGEMDTEAQQA